MKAHPLTAVILLMFLSFEVFSQSTICNYSYRKRITFNPAQVAGASDLTDFPVLINIASDNDLRVTGSGGHVVNTNGWDIIFTAADGVTVLDHDLRLYVSTTGQLQCWVKIPNLSTSLFTYIYMYYGRTVAADPSTANTWSNGYVAVWHFDNSLNNSTSTAGLNGTNNGSANSATAMFNQSRQFNGTSQFIEVTPYNAAYDITSEITVSAWVRPAAIGADQKIIGNQNGTTGGWKFGLFSDNKVEFEIRNSAGTPTLSRGVAGGTALANTTWAYVVGEYSNSGDFISTYVNGAVDRTLSTTGSLASSNGTLKIGREPFASSAFFNGNIDEIRLSNVIRSADWIATEYNNQTNVAGFYTVSAEPIAWDGSNSASWGTNANWVGNSAPAAFGDAIITSVGNAPSLNVSQQLRSLWIQSNSTLTLLNTNTLSIAYDITNCGVLLANNSSVVNFNSTSSYAQTQNISGSGAYVFINLIINNTHSTSPAVVLNKDINVLGYLQMNSGILYTSTTNLLFMALNANSSSGSATSFVSGPMSKSGATAFVFPVGKGTKWRRIGISAPASNTTFRAEYFDYGYSNASTLTAPLTDVSKNEHWVLDRVGTGTANVSVSLYWENALTSGIDNCGDLEIARWNGSSWVHHDATTVGGSTCSGTGTGTITTNAVVTAFSPFAFGSASSALNPLPVELLEFTSSCDNAGITLNWSTASEKNSDYFEVQSSIDGLVWNSIAKVKAAGNSLKLKEYVYIDDRKHQSAVYYRLKQLDTDGSIDYSPVTVSTCISGEAGLMLFPNPAENELVVECKFDGGSGKVTIEFIDNMGRICKEETLNAVDGKVMTKLGLDLKPGVYTVRALCGDYFIPAKKLVIK